MCARRFAGGAWGGRCWQHLAAKALAADADFMEWQVLDWNLPSIRFYQSLGAAPDSGMAGSITA